MTLTMHAFLFCGLVLGPAIGAITIRTSKRASSAVLFVGFAFGMVAAESGWIASVWALDAVQAALEARAASLPEAIRVLFLFPGFVTSFIAVCVWRWLARWRGWLDVPTTPPPPVEAGPYRTRAQAARALVVRRAFGLTEKVVACIGIVWVLLFATCRGVAVVDDRGVRAACAEIRPGDSLLETLQRARDRGLSVGSRQNAGDGDQFMSPEEQRRNVAWFEDRRLTSDAPITWLRGDRIDCEIDHRGDRVTATRVTGPGAP